MRTGKMRTQMKKDITILQAAERHTKLQDMCLM